MHRYSLYIKRQPLGLKNKANAGVPIKLQFFKWPLEAGSRRESIFTYLYFTAKINMFTVLFKTQYWFLKGDIDNIFSAPSHWLPLR